MTSVPVGGSSVKDVNLRSQPPSSPPPQTPLPQLPPGAPVRERPAAPQRRLAPVAPLKIYKVNNPVSQDSLLHSPGWVSATSQPGTPSERSASAEQSRDASSAGPASPQHLAPKPWVKAAGSPHHSFLGSEPSTTSSATETPERVKNRMMAKMQSMGQRIIAQGNVFAGRSPGASIGLGLGRPNRDTSPDSIEPSSKAKGKQRAFDPEQLLALPSSPTRMTTLRQWLQTPSQHNEPHGPGPRQQAGQSPEPPVSPPATQERFGRSPLGRDSFNFLRRAKERRESSPQKSQATIESNNQERLRRQKSETQARSFHTLQTHSKKSPYLTQSAKAGTTSMGDLSQRYALPRKSEGSEASSAHRPSPHDHRTEKMTESRVALRTRSSSLSATRPALAAAKAASSAPPVPRLPDEHQLAGAYRRAGPPQTPLPYVPPYGVTFVPRDFRVASTVESGLQTPVQQTFSFGGRGPGVVPGESYPSTVATSSARTSHQPSHSDATSTSDGFWSGSGVQRTNSSSQHTETSMTSFDSPSRALRPLLILGKADADPQRHGVPFSDEMRQVGAAQPEVEAQIKKLIEEYFHQHIQPTQTQNSQILPPLQTHFRSLMLENHQVIQRVGRHVDPVLEKFLTTPYASITRERGRDAQAFVDLKAADLDWFIEFNKYGQKGELHVDSHLSPHQKARSRREQLVRLHDIAANCTEQFPGALQILADELFEEYDSAFQKKVEAFRKSGRRNVQKIANELRSMAIYRLKIMAKQDEHSHSIRRTESISFHCTVPIPSELNTSAFINQSIKMLQINPTHIQSSDSEVKAWLVDAAYACDCVYQWLAATSGLALTEMSATTTKDQPAVKFEGKIIFTNKRSLTSAKILTSSRATERYEQHH